MTLQLTDLAGPHKTTHSSLSRSKETHCPTMAAAQDWAKPPDARKSSVLISTQWLGKHTPQPQQVVGWGHE